MQQVAACATAQCTSDIARMIHTTEVGVNMMGELTNMYLRVACNIEVMERAEHQGKEMVDHTVQRLAILMVIGLIGYMIVRLILLYASNRTKPSVK